MKNEKSITRTVMNFVFFTMFIAMFLSSCVKHDDDHHKYDIVYLQTNDFNSNRNAILAYRDKGDGELEALAGSPFLTNGSGVGNPKQILGPADSDYELRLSSDGKFVLSVNSGSNTIAVMEIGEGGQLHHVAGSPFPSGGQTPVSIDVAGDKVIVVNKSQDPLNATPLAPNYASFHIDNAGKLTPIPGGKVETTPGSSPSNILVSRDHKLAFGTDFLGFLLDPAVGTLRSFKIENSGMLMPVAGTPYKLPIGAMPPDNGALGLWQHPSGQPLYVGFPLQGKVGIYNINQNTGALTLQNTVAAGKAACWIRTNSNGDHMYVLNSADNAVQVYNTNNPMQPVSVQVLVLQKSGPDYPGPGGAMFKTSQPFSLHFSTSEKILYVVNQHTNADFSIGNYNYLHALTVGDDGKLTESKEPIQLPVPSNVRPKGSLVIKR